MPAIVEGTASDTGEKFFRSVVENLATSLGTMGGWVARLNADHTELRAISLKVREHWWENFVYRLRGSTTSRCRRSHALWRSSRSSRTGRPLNCNAWRPSERSPSVKPNCDGSARNPGNDWSAALPN